APPAPAGRSGQAATGTSRPPVPVRPGPGGAATGTPAPVQAAVLLRSETPAPRPYEVPLPMPPVLKPVRTDATTDYYEITQRAADVRILPGRTTPAWTYEGTFPGPTLVSRSGRRTVVRHRNDLPHPVVVHLHGGHTPHGSDGYPTSYILPASGTGNGSVKSSANGHHHATRSPVPATPGHTGGHGGGGMPGMPGGGGAPGETTVWERTYTYPMNQRAATLWYHDHRMDFTGPAVWFGLAGFHLVHDDEEDALPLPRGGRDLPLMVSDRSFTADGRFAYPALDPTGQKPGVTDTYMEGVLGDVILVNGAPWPVHQVRRLRYRLRLLNNSNSRHYRLALDPPPPGGGGLVQIGGDGGLLERPVPHDALDFAPAERFDVVVDFARYRPGTRVRLVNRLGAGGTAHVMRFDVSPSAKAPADDTRVPPKLSAIPRLDPAKAVQTRSFRFRRSGDGRGWGINSRPYVPGNAHARIKGDTTELWRIVSDSQHPVHVHLNPFQVVGRNGRAPGPYDAGWKDTVNLDAGEWVELAVRFTDYPGQYLMHCHNLEHEDMGMMGDFVVE
ncbi:multicopper oxidase domain-containing protein, partial [Streptomyces sp. B1866]|uniref:multicopper oxidase family protein n=1 Tax=Streptomyces sp. B1866 TaxID=3075431 RepID=UPI00288EF4A9